MSDFRPELSAFSGHSLANPIALQLHSLCIYSCINLFFLMQIRYSDKDPVSVPDINESNVRPFILSTLVDKPKHLIWAINQPHIYLNTRIWNKKPSLQYILGVGQEKKSLIYHAYFFFFFKCSTSIISGRM